MPKDKISQYAFTPAANTDIGGINIDEGCAPSGINNAIRTLMTQIRDLQAGVSGDTVPLTAGGTGSGTAASPAGLQRPPETPPTHPAGCTDRWAW